MSEPQRLVDQLLRATNDQDLDALVGCFAEDYENETPAHPARGFRGRDQVRRNWEQIFAAVPDVHAKVLRSSVTGDTAWTEWEMTGSRGDGTPHHMCGVILFGVADGAIQWARFYLEPVDADASAVGDAVRDQVVRG